MQKVSDSKYGLIGLILVIAQTSFVWGSLGIVYALGLWGRAPLWLEYPFGVAYLGCFAGLIFAIAGLVKGSGKACAVVALVLGAVNIVIGGFLFAV